jgi:hypothetical protein
VLSLTGDRDHEVGGRTPGSLSVSADGSYGRGYWGGSVTVGMCESGAILLCEQKSPAVRP